MATSKFNPLTDIGFQNAAKKKPAVKPKPKAIAELKADVAAQTKVVAEAQAAAIAASKKADAAIIKMDPAYAVTLAQQALSEAEAGSADYTAALRARTQAQTNLDQSNAPKPGMDAVSVARGDTYSWDTKNKKWNIIKGPNRVSTTWDSVNNKWIISSGGASGSGTGGMDGTGGGTPPGGTPPGGTPPGGGGNLNTGLDSATQNLINSLQQQVASAAKADELKASKEANDVMAALTAKFTSYNLASLIPKIKELAISGVGEETIKAELANTDEYKLRFSANQDRLKKNLTILSPSEYLAVEDAYRQTLRAYGLTQFDNDAYVKQFIANDVSPTELSNRVVTAVQRVRNADPAIQTQLKDYYGIGDTDLVAYVLDPSQQFQKIQRQVASAEIGVAAGRQGLQAGVNVAEQLAAQGVTQAEAQKGYATIADILPTAEKLSSIYGTTLEGYDQSKAEQEVFNSLASAQRARQKLTAREIAQFSGSSGMSKVSLSEGKTAGQI